MQDTDIEGMNPQDAAEYVLAFLTTLKTTQKDLEKARQDTELWKRRVALAQAKGEAGLASQAQARLSAAEAKQAQLEAETADLVGKVTVLRDKLQRIRTSIPRSVDTDLLLAQLQMITGPKDELAQSFKNQEAEARLEELKKKLSGGEPGSGDGSAGPQPKS